MTNTETRSRRRAIADWLGVGGLIAAILVTLVILLCADARAAEPEKSPSERPSWCPAGWVCMKTADAADLLTKITLLEEQNSILKKRRGKFGIVAGCGPAASLSIENGQTTLAGTLACVIGPGFRF